MQSQATKRRQWVPHAVFVSVAAITVLLLFCIFLFLGVNALRAVREIPLLEFFFSADWNPVAYGEPSWGIFSLFMGTLYVTVGAMIVAVPLGLITAIFLSEVAPASLREVCKPIVELVAGIPSVTLGLIGLVYLGPLIASWFGMSNGYNALTAALLVAVVCIPSIASMCEDALRSVPSRLRDASVSLGATQWKTIFRVIVPAARSGIAAAIMLGLGRAIGETMIVLMVAGNTRAFPTSIISPVRPMTANIAIEMKEVVVGSLHWSSLFLIGLTLFFLTFVVNVLTDLLIRKKSV